MMALTLTQPWASLMAIGAKRVETRSWQTKRRGLLAIHAAKGWTADDRELLDEPPFRGVLDAAKVDHRDVDAARGHVVAVVRLVDCVPIRELGALPPFHVRGFEPAGHELDFGGYAPGRHAWVTTDLVPLAPFRATGKQGLWEIDDALVQAAYPQEVRRG